jgi:hypothetical protein
MSGGITQLVAVGAQDAHLVGNPQVSFFRSNYKRHTNFAHVVERQTIQGNPVTAGMSTVRFARQGDLLSYVYFTQVDSGTSIGIGAAAIRKVELLIGGQVIEEHDSTFLFTVANPIMQPNSRRTGGTGFFAPLQFSFCQNWASSIPLVALQYHDVEIRITWATVDPNRRIECWADFVFLDTAEREELSNSPQDMLIQQVQRSLASGGRVQELNFNHPIKCLAGEDFLTGTPTQNSVRLQINGVDVGEAKRENPHYSSAPMYYHITSDDNNIANRFFLPFALDVQKMQPTGTLNFSRLDSARIVADANMTTSNVYAINYNVLRIQNGMGGLMYAN